MARGQQKDGDIIADLRQSIDPEACYKELWRRYYRAIVGFFQKRGCSVDESLDLAQETFLKAFRNINDLLDPEKFAAWLFSIAASNYKNDVRDRTAIKRKTERTAVSLDSASETAPAANTSVNPTTLDKLIAQESLEVVAEVLETMAPQVRRCAVLYFYQQLKYREIAVLLQISIGTVKSHIHKARSLIKKRLGFDATDNEPGRR